jgi:hypothetical protein
MEAAERAMTEQQVVEASPVFDPQLQAVLQAANERLYSDGFQLSQRIWRLDRDSLEGIRRTLLRGIAERESAWNLAQELEAYLGFDAECPRWSTTRMFRMTPTDRLFSRVGLYSRVDGGPCASLGVSYNALRLARNEIQIAHMMATDAMFANAPWIGYEQIVLSPDHPPIGCECEDIVAGGIDGEGTYEKGEISLPIHVQCMCYKLSVLTPREEFVSKLRGWMQGTQGWPAMDQYAARLGVGSHQVTNPSLLVSWGPSLLTWLWGNKEALTGALGM